MKAKSTSYLLKSDGWKIPVHVVREWRRSIRFSIGKKGAYLRFPHLTGSGQLSREIERANLWIKNQLSDNPNLAAHFYQKEYIDGQEFIVGDQTYILEFQRHDSVSFTARLKDGKKIKIQIPNTATEEVINKHIPTLLSRIIGQHQKPRISERVRQLNEQHFKRPIGTIRLKHNRSNWGSCSHTGNINLSTRLLFAPEIVQDYVIIHELAHLIEMNHSRAFYSIVASILPDYKQHEAWLKANSHRGHF